MDYLYNICIVIGVAALIIVLLYKWLTPDCNYWEEQNVPCHKPSLFSKLMNLRKLLHTSEMDLYRKYGRVYGRYDGQIPVLTVAEPDLLKEILEKNFRDFYNRRFVQFGDPVMDSILPSLNDADWKRVRNVLTPVFSTLKLKQMLSKVTECAKRTVDRLRQKMANNESADLERLIGAYLMDAIASCAFGFTLNTLESPNDPFVKHARMFLSSGISLRGFLAQNFPFVMKLFHIPIFNKDASTFFANFVHQLIEERKNDKKPGIDFLQLLLEYVKDDESSPEYWSDDHSYEELETQRKYLKSDELIAQCVMFFLAGYDSATSLLQFTMYSLATNQYIQEKLYTEIKSTLKDKETISYEDINDMSYLDAIMCEALRMSTVCVRMERLVTRDHYLQSHKILLKRGQLISLPFYCLHHDPEWYPDPYIFNPERFAKGVRAIRNKYVYLPFGIGRRSCIGNRFALMEAKLIIIMILREFKVYLSPQMKVPLTFKEKQGQIVAEKVLVNLKPRS